MSYPFIKKVKNKIFVKLNKQLYDKKLIENIRKKELNSIVSFMNQKNYYLLDLKVNKFEEYLDFLNYLIYLKKSE